MKVLKSHYEAAKAFFNAGVIFQRDTGISANKASEVLIAAVTNTWLQQHYGAAHITLTTAATGIDGYLSYDAQQASKDQGPAVEIKSSKGNQFLFGRHFLPIECEYYKRKDKNDDEKKACAFDKHIMVIFGQFDEKTNVLKCLYIAHGRNVMNELSKQLEKDTKRSSYRPENRGELRIFTRDQKMGGKSKREEECVGLDSLAEKAEFKYVSTGSGFQSANWIKVLKGKELGDVVCKLERSN